MRIGRARTGVVGAAVALAVLLSPSTGMAADPLPVGEAHGVRVERQHGAMVFTFTKRAAPLYRRIAGKRVIVDCVGLPKVRNGVESTSGGETLMRAPKRRRPLRPGEGSYGLDYCRVLLPARKVVRGDSTTHYPRQLIVAVAITQAGAVRLDEEGKAFMLRVLLAVASGDARPAGEGYITPVRLLELTKGSLWRTPLWGRGPKIVALATPGDSPPPGAIGYYSDGQQHAATAIVSAAGRRLFLEVGPDDLLHTNVADYVLGGLSSPGFR